MTRNFQAAGFTTFSNFAYFNEGQGTLRQANQNGFFDQQYALTTSHIVSLGGGQTFNCSPCSYDGLTINGKPAGYYDMRTRYVIGKTSANVDTLIPSGTIRYYNLYQGAPFKTIMTYSMNPANGNPAMRYEYNYDTGAFIRAQRYVPTINTGNNFGWYMGNRGYWETDTTVTVAPTTLVR